MCGEKLKTKLREHGAVGSPPRVRGKDGRIMYSQADVGITPACAGKSKTVDLNGRIM